MTKKIVKVYPIGTEVEIDKVIDATISGVLIRDNFIEYECQWFKGKLESQWVPEVIIKPKEKTEKIKIGFKNK